MLEEESAGEFRDPEDKGLLPGTKYMATSYPTVSHLQNPGSSILEKIKEFD